VGHATFNGCGALSRGFDRDVAVSRQQTLGNELPLQNRGKRLLGVDLFDVTLSGRFGHVEPGKDKSK
jgi:hypothetical protein